MLSTVYRHTFSIELVWVIFRKCTYHKVGYIAFRTYDDNDFVLHFSSWTAKCRWSCIQATDQHYRPVIVFELSQSDPFTIIAWTGSASFTGLVTQHHFRGEQCFIWKFILPSNATVEQVKALSDSFRLANLSNFSVTISTLSMLAPFPACKALRSSNYRKFEYCKQNESHLVNFSSNRLTVLQPETFISLPTLHSLYLEDNYWNCNCRMQPFKRMLLLSSQINIPDQPKCVSTSVVWNKLG